MSKATLKLDDKVIELPITTGSEGEQAIDISTLRSSTGLITLDQGFVNTGSCESAITFIDGEKGILRYRGYRIEDLAERSSFLEVAYLLIRGELPNQAQLDEFRHSVTIHTMLHEDFRKFYGGFPKSAHPMAVASAVTAALATFYPDSLDPDDAMQVEICTMRLLAKMPTIASYAYKHSIGQPFMYPDNNLGYAANFLRMMFGTPCEDYVVDPVIAKALDVLLILHADHEQNCSTSTVRVVGSSRANLFACIASGVSALWGPLHGGANQAVIEMLQKMEAEGLSGKQFLDKVKDKQSGIRLMGFGHRVYKNFDPRAKLIKKTCTEVLQRLNKQTRLLDLAMELEEIALRDEYFIERKLYPNVDFYSGIIYKAIGIPVDMFTVLFAIGRLPGWIAHWAEMHSSPFRISRPRQVYTGATERKLVPISDRG
ncbi:MAG: citrate synthase [Nannocystaceae bacterium]